MKLSRLTLAALLSLSSAAVSACPTPTSTPAVALAAPIVVTEPFAVPVATFVQPQALVTPTVVTPTLVTPTIVPAGTTAAVVAQTVVVKEIVRHPRSRVKVTRTITRSR